MISTALKSYLDFRLPLDIRDIQILSDIDISYALASCLVTLSRDELIVPGLADSWHVDEGRHTITFCIRASGQWSDGSLLTSYDVIKSFEDTKDAFGKRIPTLFESYTSLDAITPSEVRFTLKPQIKAEQFLKKLTAPMHGIVRATAGRQNAFVTSGPYFLKSEADQELVLTSNKHWYAVSKTMFSEVRLRQPKSMISPETLSTDPWPDLVNIPSILAKKQIESFATPMNIWRRNLDRVIALSPMSSESLARTRLLIGYWRAHANLRLVSEAVAFGVFADQIFPSGSVLHLPEIRNNSSPSSAEIIAKIGARPVTIAYSDNRMPKEVLAALENHICGVLPVKYELIPINIKDLTGLRTGGSYDFYFGGLGVDTINLDASLSYYFESHPPPVPSDSSREGNFRKRIKELRMDQDKAKSENYLEIMRDVIELNYILPIAHSSTIVIGRAHLDFQLIPSNFETVPFGMIRHKA